MIRLNQTGSHIVAIALVVVALGLTGFVGYRVMQRQNDTAATASDSSTKVPDKITNDADLNQTSEALDSTSTELDTDLNDSGLDTDLDSML